MTPEILVGARCVFHGLTALLLMGYFRPDATFKWWPSIIAGILLCSSGGLFVQCLTSWTHLVSVDPQPNLVLLSFGVFLLIGSTRGDVALLIAKARKYAKLLIQ